METKKRRATHSWFVKRVVYIYNGKLKVSGIFVDIGAPVEIKCLECSSVKGILADDLLTGRGQCVYCNALKSTPDTLRRAEVCSKEGWKMPVSMSSMKDGKKIPPFKVEEGRYFHETCGKTSTTPPVEFMGKLRCSECFGDFYTNSSTGELRISEALSDIDVNHEREKTFEYLGRKRYDFFIPSLNIAIEYDGEQHFKAVDHWGGEEALKRTQESDALKNDFCEYMGIDLLRIPYWEFDSIDVIVTNFIDTVKLMRSISANGSEMAKRR